jgi:hypothetical protein
VAQRAAAAAAAGAAVEDGDELLAKTSTFLKDEPLLEFFFMSFSTPFFFSIIARTVALAMAVGAPLALRATETAKSFASPEEAVAALVAAAAAQDPQALHVIFGPAGEDLENPDRVQATNEWKGFVAAFNQGNRIVRESDSKCVLEVGNDPWPFPVPLVKHDGRWLFDSEAGKDELLNRRIGRNELSTLQSVRAYVEAQREYASKDRDGDQVLEFAQKFASAPGKKDGLYWPQDLDGEISPLGPGVAKAQAEGYLRRSREEGAEPEPFHGYFFKILSAQGKSAPGGKYNYIINGNMIGGFALVAWPAEYGQSGIMTFIVNQLGRVYQKDLGPKTSKIAAGMKEYNPDKTWQLSPD